MTKKNVLALRNEINSLLVWDRMLQTFDYSKDDMHDLLVIKTAWNDAAKALNKLAGENIVDLRK